MEKIKCPYCEKSYIDLVSHFTQKHNVSLEQFKSEFPNLPYRTQEYEEKRLKSVLKTCSTEEFSKKMSEVNIKFNTDEYKKKLSASCKVSNSNPHKINTIREKNKEYWNQFSLEERKVKISKLIDSQQHYQNTHSREEKSQNIINGWTSQKRKEQKYKVSSNYLELDNIKFRSRWEYNVAKTLKENNINFIYEGDCVEYSFDNKNRVYVIDFSLPDYNLYLEVKPSKFIDDVTKTKINQCLKEGYNILFVSEDEVQNLQEFVNKIKQNNIQTLIDKTYSLLNNTYGIPRSDIFKDKDIV